MYKKVKYLLKKAGVWENIRSARKPRLMMRNLAYRVTKSKSEPPMPPQRLMRLVVDPPEIAWYLQSGIFAFEDIQHTLVKNGVNTCKLVNVLDFGCGTGRIAWRWENFHNSNLHGSDYNKELIKFCHKNFAEKNQYLVNSLDPPLDFEDGKFEFIYANSVFTHLTEKLQLRWMQEMRNKLKEGGYLYITVHGGSSRHLMDEDKEKKFDNGSIVVERPDRVGTNVCAAFHPPSYVRGAFSDGFDVVDHIPNGTRHAVQDIYLFRKC